MSPTEERIPVERLRQVVHAWCLRAGFSSADAATVGEVIVDADLHGVHSHGIRLLSTLAPEILRGSIDATAVPEAIKDRGVSSVIDAHHAFGPVACRFALEHVVARAAELGMAAAAIRHSSHWGQPAYYARHAAAAGMVLLAISNSAAAMPLWGATVKSVGNNPLTIGVPRQGAEPWVLDISMQQAAWGRLHVHREAGQQLPEPWGFDRNGQPSTDPAAILASGRIRPMGDHKGSGLAVMFEALTGGLAGSLHTVEVSSSMLASGRQMKSQFFLAIDPEAFGGSEAMTRLVTSFADATAGLAPAPGHQRVRLPGEGAASHRERHLRDGVPLIPALRRALEVLQS